MGHTVCIFMINISLKTKNKLIPLIVTFAINFS
jgi:hypothetical protein